MSTSRRDFLKATALAGGAVGLGLAPRAVHAGESLGAVPEPDGASASTPRAPKPLRILILGGTGFIGPYQVRYAVARGHSVTVFNRGRRQADLPDAVEHLQGDRNGQLDALKGRSWDVVIDNPTTFPKWVRDVGPILQGRTRQYIFISSISAYAGFPAAGMDETSALAKYSGADPFAETAVTGANYGPLKALSEREAEKWFPGRTTVVRPGLIVGPGDDSDRFTYWPARIARGGEVLAPGDGRDPVQIIDARDLAEWVIRMAEQGDVGIYNATGPRRPLSMQEQLYGIRAVTDANIPTTFTWVDAAFLEQQNVRGWSDMPTWVPARGDNAGWSRVSIDRALAKGLTFRPLAVTAKDTLDWHATLPAERREKMRAGLPAEREQAVLAAWHASRQQKSGDRR